MRFISLEEKIDTGTESGKQFIPIIAAYADYFRETHSERAGCGRSTFVPTPKKQKVVDRRIRDQDEYELLKKRVEGGEPIQQVARAMNVDYRLIYSYIRQFGWDYEYKVNSLRRGGERYLQSKQGREKEFLTRLPELQDETARQLQYLLEESLRRQK